MVIDETIKKLLYDRVYQNNALKAFNDGKFFDVFDNEAFSKHYPYLVSEKLFLEIIDCAKSKKVFKKIFINIEPYIMVKENITDTIFEELLKFAADGNSWIYLGLCHADLSASKNDRLKSLGLDESLWY